MTDDLPHIETELTRPVTATLQGMLYDVVSTPCATVKR
jgi:hypothetical protein